MRTGVRLALDWGQARIGIAACDAGATLAYPVCTIRNYGVDDVVWDEIDDVLAEYQPMEIIVGLPRHLKGSEGEAAQGVRQRAATLVSRYPDVPVRLVDERLSTVMASRQLRDAGRGGRGQRQIIDQAAAVAILEGALQTERNTGQPPGELITEGCK